jgi:hypothetical protein
MWHIIGIDEDGARHHWNEAETKEQAEELLAKVKVAHNKMVLQHIEAVEIARQDEIEGRNAGLFYSDYMAWKMQGFYIDHFILEYKEGY